MDLLRDALLVVHLLGLVALLVGLLVQVRRPRRTVTGLVRDGAGTVFLAGLLLVGVIEADGGRVDHAEVAVKGLIGLAVLVLVMANLGKEQVSTGLWALVLGLTLANVGVAVLWGATPG